MTAIIYDFNTQSTYVSPIFAIKRNEVIAFNADRSGIKRVNRWNGVYIVSKDDFDYQNRKWRGCEWVVGNEKLFRALKYGRTASLEDFPEFKKYDEEIILPEWFEIKNEDDAKILEALAGDYIDCEAIKFTRDASSVEVKVDTTEGCYLNIRLLDILGETPSEFMDYVVSVGIKADSDGFSFLYGGSQIRCKRVLWNIEVITKPYLRLHRNYPDISALYEDIKIRVKNTELIDGKLVINGNDKIEAELKHGEYVTCINGKREKGSVEDQDIYPYLLGFAFDLEPPKILWQFSRSRIVHVLRNIRNFFIFAVPGFFAITVGVLFDNGVIRAIGSTIGGIFFFAAFIAMCGDNISYRIHNEGISGGSYEYLPFSAIEGVELRRSRIFKKRATIKLTANGKKYYLRFITGADEAYELILSRINTDKKKD